RRHGLQIGPGTWVTPPTWEYRCEGGDADALGREDPDGSEGSFCRCDEKRDVLDDGAVSRVRDQQENWVQVVLAVPTRGSSRAGRPLQGTQEQAAGDGSCLRCSDPRAAA